MGLFLTLLYILTAYLGPQTLWGPLSKYHIEIVVAALATLASLSGLARSRLFSIPQTYALGGMVVSVILSMIFTGWLGSVPGAVLSFIPNVFAYFLVILNCRKRSHLQMLVGVLLLVSVFTIARGYLALRAGNYLSPYLIGQGTETGGVYRLRGLAFINDPNDFSQLMASLIPCLFLFWRKQSTPRNVLLVLIPSTILVFGMFLTHSRGGMVALLAVILFASRRKIGTVAASIMAGLGFAGATVLGWSGGRDVSVEAGSDRLEAWSTGLQLIKEHPLFGVGYMRFNEYFYITAHNTIVVCAAELGLFGLFWWLTFVFPTVRDAYVASKGLAESDSKQEEEFSYATAYATRTPEPAAEMRWQPADAMTGLGMSQLQPAAPGVPLHLSDVTVDGDDESLPAEEIHRIAGLMPICLVGYFVAGWFLSRAYIMTLFIYGGMVQVIYRWALDQDLAPPRLGFPKIMQYAAMLGVALIVIVYLALRLDHLVGH